MGRIGYQPGRPCFIIEQLSVVLGLDRSAVSRILKRLDITWWYFSEVMGVKCFDSDEVYKEIILQPAWKIYTKPHMGAKDDSED